MTPDCVLCRILRDELPSTEVYRDDLCVVLMDIRPVNPGHMLVMPLRHVELLGELDQPTIERLVVVAQRLTVALRRSALQCEAVTVLLADGPAAGQDVAHVHVHVIPRHIDGRCDRQRPGADADRNRTRHP